MHTPKIAFLGLGTMGAGMAHRLHGAGHVLTVYNRNPERAAPLAREGAHIAASPADAAKGADIIIAMLADDTASRAVWTGPTGALATAKPNAILLDASTLTVQWVHELAALAAAKNLRFLDAPVTGTKPHAANGELTFLVGGDPNTLDEVRPILAPMSKEVIHLGPTGAGAALKLINNFVCGIHAVAIAEAIALLNKFNLDEKTALPILVNGAPGSPVTKALTTRYTNNDPTAYFQLKLLAKDLSYAIKEATAHHLPLPTTQAALDTMKKAIASGLGDQDMSSLLKFARSS